MIDKRFHTALVHLYVLRPFRIEQKGSYIHLPTRKTASLLAYLALHPGFHSREKLATLFWADSSDASARGSLRKAINFIRKHLGNETILADREHVQLNPDYDLYCDAVEFERQVSQFLAVQNPDIYEMDLELYQNELLTDFYDDWAFDEREHYHQLYIKVLLRAIEVLRAQSEYNTAIQYAKKLLIHETTNEQAYQHLIFCHVTLGDRHGALQQYEACRNVLETELGVEPARETRALYEWITQSSDIRSLAARITNLPIPISSFVGRSRELAEIKQVISNARLVTLTGVGGSGKTRLGIRVATELIDCFHNGVWWVDLSSLSSAALVPQSVAKCLGVIESPEQALIESIIAAIEEKEMLLVLDNCEHLVEACAQLVNRLLTQCPHLKVLTTSREALRVDGEVVFSVPTLLVPNMERISISELLLDYDSVRLFVTRARAVQSGIEVDDQTAVLIAQICTRLDGIPLAIELAAARVRTMSVQQITANLDHAFRLLTGGSHAALPRQQTLRAMIDWSYDLLSKQEKMLFRRLSIFMGGLSLEAAEAVCSGDGIETGQILDDLSQLVQKSVIIAEDIHGEVRYHMLETLRQYVYEKLKEIGEEEVVHERHTRWCVALAERAEPKLRGHGQLEWLERIEREIDNIRAALEWSFHNNYDLGLRICNALMRFWVTRGHELECIQYVEKLLTAESLKSTPLYAKSLARAAWAAMSPTIEEKMVAFAEAGAVMSREVNDMESLAFSLAMSAVVLHWQGKNDHALWLFEESLALFDDANIVWGRQMVLGGVGYTSQALGDYEQAHAAYQESLALCHENGDIEYSHFVLRCLGGLSFEQGYYEQAIGLYQESLFIVQVIRHKSANALILQQMADANIMLGRYSQAKTLLEESIAIQKELGLQWQPTWALNRLGRVVRLQGDYEEAVQYYAEGLRLAEKYGSRPGLAWCLAGLAELSALCNQPKKAARLLGAAEAVPELYIGLWPQERVELEQISSTIRTQLDETDFKIEKEAGRQMKLEEAIRYALEGIEK
jgi:predicted ATPase